MELDSVTEFKVGASLPQGAMFGRENFAGDPIIREFFESMSSFFDLQVDIFVSWACVPDVLILRTRDEHILVRSERFDTLLVEYVRLSNSLFGQSADVQQELIESSFARWMAEFFIGYRKPLEAIEALLIWHFHTNRLVTSAFRDEILSSVPDLQRTALQCFCLAHEIGHVLYPTKDDASLKSTVDGISLSRHVDRDMWEAKLEPDARHALQSIVDDELDASHLLNEIEADLFAFENVVRFLYAKFECEIKEAIHATLVAYEAQSHVYAWKNTCLQLRGVSEGKIGRSEFTKNDWLYGLLTSVRSRCVLRKAAFVWARLKFQDAKRSIEDINSLVPKIDEIYLDEQENLYAIAECSHQLSMRTLESILESKEHPGTRILETGLQKLNELPELKLDLFYILVVFGCPGGTDVELFIKNLTHGRPS